MEVANDRPEDTPGKTVSLAAHGIGTDGSHKNGTAAETGAEGVLVPVMILNKWRKWKIPPHE
ncbi:hypothetical protein [Microbulbifer spongiae]|uniref:Uncharacterized protein n=1 Tax=Microbulbifer spongiae TaxID=2944933 RepID=A0ABY9E6J1_9GAMM|nr:hypothetical protein [Microbulbifer sp. MI-G]WKD48645.1 hypothetical protein M8T91_12035 [Microbulbifer sp. MI-G]